MQRRTFVGLGATLTIPALPRVSRAQSASLLRFVPASDLSILDPILTSTYITRNHGYMVFDQLYGQDDQFRAQPQMAEGHRIEEDGRRVTIRLRPGLLFHDGELVRARDAVASILRWAARDQLGQTILGITDELSAPNDHDIVFRLKRPFALLFDALAKTSPPVAFMMPERLALTEPSRAITEIVGSGPFRFLPDERVPGARNVYAKFDRYLPRDGVVSSTAGPKVVHFERVEWQTIPDASTAAAAIQAGEIDAGSIQLRTCCRCCAATPISWWRTPTRPASSASCASTT